MTWLGLFDASERVAQAGSCLDALCALMQRKMAYGADERDLVLLQHTFHLLEADGQETRHVSRLVAYGDDKYSAMARLVGTPAAIATKLILDEHVIRKGVITPLTPDIYSPMLDGLQRAGITSFEGKE